MMVVLALGCGRGSEEGAPPRAAIEPEAPARGGASAGDAGSSAAKAPGRDGGTSRATARAADAGAETAADGGAPAPGAAGGPRVCWTALGGDEMHEGNEDPTSFDLAFTTVAIAGLAPIEVAGQAALPDFVDGDERIEAPPGATKLRLRSPLKAWFHGPATRHCEAAPAAASATTPRAPRATVPGVETRAWARGLKIGGPLLHAGRVPGAVAAEIAPLLEAARAGTKLRWVRALAPPTGEAGPALLVASHRDRQAVPARLSDAGVASSLEITLALLADDGRAYGLVDVASGRMHDEEPWQLAPALRVDGDPHPDTILVAPVLEGEAVQDGLVVALTESLAVSRVGLFPRDDSGSAARQVTCFGRVEDRTAFFVVRDRGVDAFVADASGHLVRAPSLWGQVLAWSQEPESFTPIHTNDGSRYEEGPLDPSEVRRCPAAGAALDLEAAVPVPGSPRGDPRLVRVHRLALTKAAVGRQSGVLHLSALPARR